MKLMPLPIALKFYQHFPEDVVLTPIEDENTGFWSCAIDQIETDNHGRDIYVQTLYELGEFRHSTEQGAVKEMEAIVKRALSVIKVMSN